MRLRIIGCTIAVSAGTFAIWALAKPKDRMLTKAQDVVPAGGNADNSTYSAVHTSVANSPDHGTERMLVDRANRVRELSESDPDAAFRYIESNYEAGPTRDQVQASLLVILGMRDLANIDRFLKLVTSGERFSALQTIGSAWAKRDASAFRVWATTHLDGMAKNYALAGAAIALVEKSDFHMAQETIDAIPFSNQRIEMIKLLAGKWGGLDADAALSWAKALPLPEERDNALFRLAYGVKDRYGADGLADLVNAIVDPSFRKNLTTQIIDTFAETGQAADAKKWVESLPAEFNQTAFTKMIDKFASGDLNGWSEYVLKTTDKQNRSNGVQVMVGKYFVSSPQDASQWVLKLPQADKWTGISSLVSNWYGTDSLALSDWINQLPGGKDRDRALECLAYALKSSDATAAKDVAGKIGDKELQGRVGKWLGN